VSDGPAIRLERLLPFAVVAAAAVLFASELMITFEFTPPGAEALDEQSAADRHYYAQIILAVGAVAAMFGALATGSKPAAMAVAAFGVVSLLIFLLLDLPDANQIGTLDDARESFFEAEAVPQAGFWLELVGALGLALSGAALATLTPEQIAALRPGGGREPKRRDRGRRRPAAAGEQAPGHEEVQGEPAGAGREESRARSERG